MTKKWNYHCEECGKPLGELHQSFCGYFNRHLPMHVIMKQCRVDVSEETSELDKPDSSGS